MCGIIAAFKTQTKKKKRIKDVNEFIINQFEEQYSRGIKGFGIIRINNKQKINIDRACEPTKFLLDLYMKKSKMIIAHHRFPTSTDNQLNQTHPMFISNKLLKKDYYIIHNGVISNDKKLYEKHTKLGFEYKTEYIEENFNNNITKFNDSESLAIELALFIEGKTDKIDVNDKAAFIILQTNKKTKKAEKVYFGKNKDTSFLNIEKKEGSLKLSSEGKGKLVEENKLFSFKIKDPKMTLTKRDIQFKKEEIKEIQSTNWEKKKYDKNTKEIEKVINLRPYRAWILEITEDLEYPNLNEKISIDHIGTACAEFITDIKESTAMDITHIIDESLDKQITYVIDTISEFKTILLSDKLTKEDTDFYKNQIKTVMKTMSAITNIAENNYIKKEMEEELTSEKNFIDLSEPITDISEKEFLDPMTNKPFSKKLCGF